jgi:acetyl esterase/lipase
MMKRLILFTLGLAVFHGTSLAQAPKKAAPTKKAPAAKKKEPVPIMPATAANVSYGSHPKQVVDFYQAKSDKPTPCMLFIHGGGWTAGSKLGISGLKECLAAGISVVSVEYRFVPEAYAAGIKPPVKWPLDDAARALQFVRSKAAEWNIDKERIGASGGSAGACSSLYLAFHDDMADPKSSDPVARESTRLWCAAVSGAQTTLDPQQMKEWTPNSRYGGHAFGFMADPKDLTSRDKQFDRFLANRESVLEWINQYSPYAHVSAGDPPIYLFYVAVPNLGQPEKDPTHTANFGVKLKEKCDSVNVPCELRYPNAPNAPHASTHEYLIMKLKE